MERANGAGFDVAMAREFYDRQRADAERVVLLCDSAQSLFSQLEETKKKLAAAEAELTALKSVPRPA